MTPTQARPPLGSLFSIGEDVLALHALLDEFEDDQTKPAGELDAAMDSFFVEVSTAQAAKFDGYVNYIRALEMRAAAASEEAERYRMVAKSASGRVAFLKQRMHDYLVRTGQKQVMTATGRTITVTNNGGHPGVTYQLDLDATKLEARFTETKVTVDAKAVKAALDAGETLGFAVLKPHGSHVRIK